MIIGQSTSANIIVGPLMNVSASIMVTLNIANAAISLHKNGGSSAARSNTTSAASVGPGLYQIALNSTDTNTLGELAIIVSGSGAILFRKDVDIWQAPTFNLFYGSADEIAMSADFAALSAAISGRVAQAIVDADLPSSADVSAIFGTGGTGVTSAAVSAIISVVVAQALADYDVASSADVSVIVSALIQTIAMTSASLSSQIHTALVSYDVATSADVSAIVAALVPGSAAVSGIVGGALTNYDAPTSSDVSAIVAGVLTNSDIATSADVSVIVSAVLASYNVASAGEVASATINSAGISAIVQTALVNYDAPTSADVSAIVAANAGAGITSAQASSITVQVLNDYDALTSAKASAVHVNVLTNYGAPTSASMSAMVSAVVDKLFSTEKVNIGFVNNVSVGGIGTTANPWGPT